MKRAAAIFGAWAGATVLAALVAWAAVGVVGDQVSDDVDLPLSAEEVVAISEAQAVTTTTPVSVPESAATTSTEPEATSVTSSPEGSAPAPQQTRAITVQGGTVVVRWSPTIGVELTSATPDQGWSVEVEHAGPPSVEVKFKGPGGAESEIHMEVSSGELEISTES